MVKIRHLCYLFELHKGLSFEAHLHKLAFFVDLCLAVLGRELELEPQVVVTVLQLSEEL